MRQRSGLSVVHEHRKMTVSKNMFARARDIDERTRVRERAPNSVVRQCRCMCQTCSFVQAPGQQVDSTSSRPPHADRRTHRCKDRRTVADTARTCPAARCRLVRTCTCRESRLHGCGAVWRHASHASRRTRAFDNLSGKMPQQKSGGPQMQCSDGDNT